MNLKMNLKLNESPHAAALINVCKEFSTNSEMEKLKYDLELQEFFYLQARMKKNYELATISAEEMARLHRLLYLCERQEKEERE